MRTIAISDIHGCYKELKELLFTLETEGVYDKNNDKLVFLGDYIDRGIQNVETLKFLISLNRKPNVIFLKGNHELSLIKYINEEKGVETVEQAIQGASDIIAERVTFLSSKANDTKN